MAVDYQRVMNRAVADTLPGPRVCDVEVRNRPTGDWGAATLVWRGAYSSSAFQQFLGQGGLHAEDAGDAGW